MISQMARLIVTTIGMTMGARADPVTSVLPSGSVAGGLHPVRKSGLEITFQLIDGRVVLANLRFKIQDRPVMRLACLLQLPETFLLSQTALSDYLLKGSLGRFLSPCVPGLGAQKPGQGTRRKWREVLPLRDG